VKRLTTYDQIAYRYDTSMRRFERWWLGDLREQTLSLLPPNSRILEIGAGTGLNFVFYPPGTSGVATEKSREMLKFAREKPRSSRVSLVQNCAEELPFTNSSFDVAFGTLVLCSVASPVKAFEELRRVVRSGGTVILLEHVRPGGLLGPVFDLLNFLIEPLFEDHFNRRTAETARAAGLEVLDVRKHAWGIINLITCRVN
jgi:phosphatidylethanolamine/phosphatidyl-N-methylethanolamine N-methyltransferase